LSFFNELKRRNVFKVGIAYIVMAWLVMQVADVILNNIEAPGWVFEVILLLLGIGFLLALFFAWVFELTPDGLKREHQVDRSQSITSETSRKLDFIIIVALVVALGYFAYDKLVLSTQRDAALIEATTQALSDQAVMEKASTESDKSIAVLPFVNMSDDASNEFFSDGISEELLNLLAKIPDLRVTSRSSSFAFKGEKIDIPVVAEKLNVAHILEGSVRKAGNQVRITAQLIEARSDTHLWSETYDRSLDNIFAIQDEIAVAVVAQLKITLLGAAPKVKKTDSAAYAQFLQGRYYYDRNTEVDSHKAVAAYQNALDIDPEYAEALAGLSLAVGWQAGFGFIEYEPGVARALAAARKAVELDPELALAWVSLSSVQEYLWEWQARYESALKAVELDPGNSLALATAAQVTRDLGQYEQSLGMFQKALVLDPLNLDAILSTARAYSMVDRYEESEQQYLNLLALNPDYKGVHSQYAYTLLLSGRYQDALSEAEKEPEAIWNALLKVFALYGLGKHEESETELKAFIEVHHEFWAYQIAEVYSWRDDADEAFYWLDAALQYRDPGLSNLMSDRTLRNLYSDPRWEPFLNEVGFLEAWQAMPAEYKGPTK
jgi:TolB-like protein